jgi:HD-like signal output (HDOD) protein
MQLLRSDETRLKELSDLICTDQSFSAEVLRLANSPLFGFRTEIKGILQAIALLGAERIKAVAFTVGMRAYLAEPLKIPVLHNCWRHNLACAIVAEKLGHVSLMEEDFAYTAGLLHDIGRLALMVAQPLRYARLVTEAEEGPFNILEREREWFDIDHCEAGQWLVESWKLPRVFGMVAAHHHMESRRKTFDIIALVHASCRLSDAFGYLAIRPLATPTVDQVLTGLPEREQTLFRPHLERLIVDIDLKIKSLE